MKVLDLELHRDDIDTEVLQQFGVLEMEKNAKVIEAGESLEKNLRRIQDLLKQDVEELKKDVFRYLHQTRIQSFEQICPYLNTPIPYKVMGSMSLEQSQVEPINYSVDEQVMAFDKKGNEVILHPMINAQFLPCYIHERAFLNNVLTVKLKNNSGFFYLENDYIDLWVFDANEQVASFIFDEINKASFRLNFDFDNGGTVHKAVKVKPLHYAYAHPNERRRDELRDGRFYYGLRLNFENDFMHLEVKEAQLDISKITSLFSESSLEKDRIKGALEVNYVPLINYQSHFAMQVPLDGIRDSYPLISEQGRELSLLKIFSVKVSKDTGEHVKIYPSVISDSHALSFDLIRPCHVRKIKHSHIMVYNPSYGEDLSLQIDAAWFDPRREIGELSKFRFISKPVEKISIKTVYYTESCSEMVFDMEVMHKVQYLTYQKTLTASDLRSFLTLMTSEERVQNKLKFLNEYLELNPDVIYQGDACQYMYLHEDSVENAYLNKILLRLLIMLKSLR